jgi:hypothetical protein
LRPRTRYSLHKLNDGIDVDEMIKVNAKLSPSLTARNGIRECSKVRRWRNWNWFGVAMRRSDDTIPCEFLSLVFGLRLEPDSTLITAKS